MNSKETASEIIIGIDEVEPRFSLPSEASLALLSIAERNGITPAQAIAISVANDNFLHEQVDNGAQLFIRRGSTQRRLEYSTSWIEKFRLRW